MGCVLILKGPFGLAEPYHLLAVCIKRIVYNPLRSVDFEIVRVAEMAKSFGYSSQSGTFRLVVKPIVSVGTVDNPGQLDQGWITCKLILFDNGLK